MFGCTDQQSKQCTGVGGINKSEIASGNLTAELGFIKNVEKSVVVGLDFKPPLLQKALFLVDGRIVDSMNEPNAQKVLDRLKALGD